MISTGRPLSHFKSLPFRIRQRTWTPRCRRASARWLPINPVPPVTRAFKSLSPCLNRKNSISFHSIVKEICEEVFHPLENRRLSHGVYSPQRTRLKSTARPNPVMRIPEILLTHCQFWVLNLSRNEPMTLLRIAHHRMEPMKTPSTNAAIAT